MADRVGVPGEAGLFKSISHGVTKGLAVWIESGLTLLLISASLIARARSFLIERYRLPTASRQASSLTRRSEMRAEVGACSIMAVRMAAFAQALWTASLATGSSAFSAMVLLPKSLQQGTSRCSNINSTSSV